MRKSFFIWSFFIALLTIFNCCAQQHYIVVERLGGKRIRMTEGDDFHFRLYGETAMYHDVLLGFKDSTILISSGIKLQLKDISGVYFPKKLGKTIRYSLQTLGLSSPITSIAVLSAQKNGFKNTEAIRNAALFSVGAIAAAQLARFIPNWKKYKMYRNCRIWIYK